ncbi:PepSY-like domain-containing protein [Pedobacter sp. SYSU D00535]|uniref:PepSY-like domain-containing protein n=1 Tax=Pedobacter sp. SYSU D00535 TaxID=2810308 RepID=UPI001A97B88A|nr:PepSY-like domain-containing protein [Pedobacter sp. SYSU D00535]
MKTLRFFTKLFMGAAVLSVTATSCQKDATDPANDVEDSQAILVSESSASADAVYIVNTGSVATTRDSITADQLPSAIGTYLSTYYSGYTLKKAFRLNASSQNNFIVVINYQDKPVGLLFDADGNFIKVFEQRERGSLRGKGWKHGGRFDGRDGKHRDTIALTSLSTAIKAYFQLSYPTDTLLHAHGNKDGSVVVISTNNGLYATAFSSTSLFIKRAQIIAHKGKKTAIAQAQLPATIAAYLTTTFPGYVFNRAFAIRSNTTVQSYVVFIDASGTKYGLQFDASGQLAKSVVIR